MVRVGTLMAVPGLLQERGVDPARMLAEFGLEPAYFEDPDNTIAFATEGRILARCAELTRCPHFGLLNWLDKAPPGTDPLLNKMMAQRVRDIESHFGEDLVGQLRRLLPSLDTQL